MTEQILSMIQKAGYLIRELNEKFYFYVDIETIISWTVIFLMYLLYKLVSRYFRDTQLDALELIKLLAIYLLILSAIMASYVDITVIMNRANPEYSFFMITIGALAIVIILAWASRDPAKNKRWILGALYVPILLLMITNGRILEERFDTITSLMPRSDIQFLGLPGEVKQLRVGGVVPPRHVAHLEQIITSHQAVRDSAVVGRSDHDGLVKPYAYVILEKNVSGSKELKADIKKYVSDRIERNWIPPHLAPSYVDFIERDQLPRTQYQQVRQIINQHPDVSDSSVIGRRDESAAYVVLKGGAAPSKSKKREIRRFVYEKIRENNKLSPFLTPQWIEFIDNEQVPRDKSGQIKRFILQKRAKNWSEVFPNPPDPFDENSSAG